MATKGVLPIGGAVGLWYDTTNTQSKKLALGRAHPLLTKDTHPWCSSVLAEFSEKGTWSLLMISPRTLPLLKA